MSYSLVWDMPDHVAAYVSIGLWGDLRGFVGAQACGIFDGKLIGGVVYHDWNPDAGTIEVTAYFERHDWMTRDRLRKLFAYPFDAVGCRMVVARHSEENRTARRIWKAWGARETCIPELHAPGVALCVATLSADDWRGSRFMKKE